MEDLFITVQEHEVLKKCKIRLEKRYRVQIFMPEVEKFSSQSEVIFASIYGEQQNIDSVKKFVSKRISRPKISDCKDSSDVIVVTLSDSEEDPASPLEAVDLIDSLCTVEASISSRNKDLSVTSKSQEDSICIIESSSPKSLSKSLDDSVCIIETLNPIISTESSRGIRKKKAKSNAGKNKGPRANGYKKVSLKNVLPSTSGTEDSQLCEVSSTTEEPVLKKPRLCTNTQCSLKERTDNFKALPDFISLHMSSKAYCNQNASAILSNLNGKVETDDDIIILDGSEIRNVTEVKKPTAPRRLRPIVIDGSNVARQHGIVSESFSSKGIQLCVEYFLNRGHTSVTAFIPRYRMHGDRFKKFPTTDPAILEDLEKRGHLIPTPSRRIQGQVISCYDDRFVVQLASKNGGVIVSNDNFKDLLDENELFREAIEKRLLMFCFVGDEFMVPDDPLGRNGPTLNDYLSFSPDEISEL